MPNTLAIPSGETASPEPRWRYCLIYAAALVAALLLAWWLHEKPTFGVQATPDGATADAGADASAGLTVLVLLTILAQFAEHAIEPVVTFLHGFKWPDVKKSELGMLVASATLIVSVIVCAHWGLYLLESLGWTAPSETWDAFVTGVALSGGTKLLHAVADATKKPATAPDADTAPAGDTAPAAGTAPATTQ